MALKVGELYGVLTIDRKGFDKGLSKGRMAFGKFAKVLKFGAIGIAVALAGIALAAGKMAIDFQKNMANVQSLLGTGSEAEARIADLKDDVKSISTETGKSLEDLAGGLYQVVSAFGDTADSSAKLDIAAKASIAGVSTTTDAVSLLSAVTKGYGNTTLVATQKAADFAFLTVKLGQTDFPQLASQMGKVIPVAANLGVKQRELWAIMATLTGVTGNTSEVTTQLRGAMIAFQKPNTDMKKALKELGLTGANAGKQLIKKKGLVGAIEMIDSTSKAGTVGLAKLLGKAPALTAAQFLIGDGADDLATKYEKMGDRGGSMMDAYTVQQDTVAARWKRINANFSVMLVNLGDKFLPVLEEVLDLIIDNMPEITAALDAVFGLLGDVLGQVSEFVSSIFGSGDGDGDSIFDTLGNTIEWLTTEILPPLSKAFNWLKDKTLPVLSAMIDTVVGVFNNLVSIFDDIAEIAGPALGELFDWFVEEVLPPFEDMLERISDEWLPAVSAAFDMIAKVAGPLLGGVIKWLAETILPILKGAFNILANVIVPAVETAINGLASLIGGAGTTIENMVSGIKKAWSGLVGFFSTIWRGIKNIVVNAVNAVIDMLNKMSAAFAFQASFEIPSFEVPDPTQLLQGGKIKIGGGTVDFSRGRLFPEIDKFAAGTQGFKGGFAMLGEMGPELAYLPSGSEVLNASKTRDFLDSKEPAGGIIIQEQNINGIMPDEVERQTRRAFRREKLERQLSGA